MTPLQFEVQLRNYTDNRTDKTFTSLMQTLNSLSSAQLNDLCLQSETIRKALQEPDFLPFWQVKMAKIKIKRFDDFTFRATQSLSPMDISLGYFNYLQAVKANIAKNPDEEAKYIDQALKFHFFHALKHYSEDERSFELTVETLAFFEEEARWHGTPGYLVVAKLYYGCAQKLIQKAEDPRMISAAFQIVIKNLRFAGLMEDESVEDIHNAYYAQGLAQSVAALRQACIDHAGSYLSQNDIDIATHAAELQCPARAKPVATEPDSLSSFYQAILADSPELMRVLSKQKLIDNRNSAGESPLVFAVRHGKIDSVRCILALEANPALEDLQANKALALAIQLGHQGIARLLAKAKPELLRDSLIIQLGEENTQLIDALGKIPQKRELEELVLALANKSDTKMRACLEKGISPDVILPSGKTCLMALFETQNAAGIELFLEFGVSLSQRDSKGENILFSVMERIDSKDNTVYFRRFVSLGANINTQNKEGETLLIKAVKQGDLRAVTFLLKQENIDVNLRDARDMSALDYAADNEWIAALLVEHNAEQPLRVEKQTIASFIPSQFLRLFGLAPKVQPGPIQSIAASPDYTS